MNRILFILMILFLSIPIFSQLSPDKQFYVTTKAGLVMREKPDVTSGKIAVIPYRTILSVLRINYPSMEINGVNGFWKRVEYNKTEGWVFSGYLDRIDPDYRARVENKSCRYEESMAEFPNADSVLKIQPFLKSVNVPIPCILDKETFRLDNNIREVRVSTSGKWLVIDEGTDIYGTLFVYDLPARKLLHKVRYMDIKYISDESFEYTVIEAKCMEHRYLFEGGEFKEIGKYKVECPPY